MFVALETISQLVECNSNSVCNKDTQFLIFEMGL